MIITDEPFENEDEKREVYWNINRVLVIGGRRFLTKKQKDENLNQKKSILFSLALRKALILKKYGKIQEPIVTNNIEDISEINKILLSFRYTKGLHEYDIGTKELIQIPNIQA